MTRQDLRELAEVRLEDARVLTDAGRIFGRLLYRWIRGRVRTQGSVLRNSSMNTNFPICRR